MKGFYMAKETNILKERLFSAVQIAPLKNTSSLLIANIADCMCAIAYECNSLQKLIRNPL